MTGKTQLSRSFVSVIIALFLVLIVTFGATTGTARAEEHMPRCGKGEVQSAFQALPVGLWTVGESRAGLGGAATHCRLNIFDDGATYTFRSSDLIIGGVVNFIPLEFLGVTYREAVDILLTAEDRVYMGPAGTPVDQLVEQELKASAFKSAMHPDFGHIVYQHKAFITQLEPGDYISYYVWEWPILSPGTETETVHVEVLP